jgi:glycogen operon protein
MGLRGAVPRRCPMTRHTRHTQHRFRKFSSHRPSPRTIELGRPDPLGATWDGAGTNFAVYSSVAHQVELCLFDEQGRERRIRLPASTRHVWHGYVRGVHPGTRYGFRVHGEWDPSAGLRCNPSKLLLDPYARQIAGDLQPGTAALPYTPEDPEAPSEEDSAPAVPRSVVIDPSFDWGDDHPPARPMRDTVFYEAHVKGLTIRRDDIPEPLRGTYAGLAHPAMIDYYRALGITAIELMPVHAFVHEGHLLERGLCNYWGYASIGFFAPHHAYVSPDGLRDPVREFKTMVKALHAAGLEVILDVVYNHTAEGNHLGPSLSFRGLDNAAYYHLVEDNPRFYMDYTGTGNSLRLRHPTTLRLVLDSLRYWVTEMHVDGFRFDLAVTLGRTFGAFDGWSSFFAAVHQDPVLRRVKLVAEPWDSAEGGYQVGCFYQDWAEWNGRYRDTVRDFWRSQPGTLPDLAARLTGSADLFSAGGRLPDASVNLVTAHDGFTLQDLVSYNDKHNEANGEENRDGESHNRSWNLGEEGPTDSESVQATRRRQRRNLLTTLLLSQGTPLLLHGDELGRTQQGNNNVYCQDNELSWVDWTNADRGLVQFVSYLLSLRAAHPIFRRQRWMHDRRGRTRNQPPAHWHRPDGQVMTPHDWSDHEARTITLVLDGTVSTGLTPAGTDEFDDTFCLVLNARLEPVEVVVPPLHGRTTWQVVVDTSEDEVPGDRARSVEAGSPITVPDLAMLVLTMPRAAQ